MESQDEELQPIQPGSSISNGETKSYSSSSPGEQFGYKTLKDTPDESEGEPSTGCCGKMDVMKRFLILSLVFTSTVLIVFISLFIWRANIDKTKQVCIDDECIRSSAFILNMMKQDVKPCEDLYSFSCGRWIQNQNATLKFSKLTVLHYMALHLQDEIGNILSRSSSRQDGRIVTSIEKAFLYFQNCQNETDIELLGAAPIKKMIADLQGWSIGDKNWSNKSWNFLEALTLNQKIGGSAFFSVSVENSDWDANLTVLSFMQTGLTLKAKEAYIKDASSRLFANYAKKIVSLLGIKQKTHNKIMDLYQFEKKLAHIFTNKDEMIDPIKTRNRIKLSQLTELVGNKINFTLLVAGLRGKAHAEDLDVVVASDDYFERLKNLLQKTSDEVLANYIVLNTIEVMSMYMPRNFLKAYLGIFESWSDLTKIQSRWKHCVNAVKTAFPLPLAALYALKNFPISSKREVERMFEEIREEFIESIPKLDWMDAGTKSEAITKAKTMQVVIGFPEWILNWDQLDEYYNKSHVVRNHYFENEVNLRISKCEKVLEFIDHPFNLNKFAFDALDVNAFYNSKNFAIFPAGLLQKPMYDKIFPLSYNFGSLGSVIGHEFIHGFDNSGRRFNSEGILHNWWSNVSNHEFETKAKCVQEQYSSYNDSGRTIDGLFSLGENIADNGGLQIAYRAYQKRKAELKEPLRLAPGLNLTHDQVFFVGFSQHWCTVYKTLHDQNKDFKWKHAPGMLRVRGSVSNMKTFSDAYGCSVDAKLNPSKKCTFW